MKWAKLFAFVSLAFALPVSAQARKDFAATYQSENFEIAFFISEEGKYEIAKTSEATKKHDLIKLEREYFKAKLDELFDNLKTDTEAEKIKLSEVSLDLLFQIQEYLRNEIFRARLTTTGPGDKIGTLHLFKDEVAIISCDNQEHIFSKVFTGSFPDEHNKASGASEKNSPEKYLHEPSASDQVKIKSVEMYLEGGIIADLIVSGILTRKKDGKSYDIQYRNLAPIPLGTPKEIDLFNGGSYLLLSEQKFRSAANAEDYEKVVTGIDPSMFLRYERHVVGAGTYVPKDGVTMLTFKENEKNVALEKHSFIRNLDTRIYSDITGLQANNPNGVLQIEIKYDHISNTRSLSKYRRFWRNSVIANRLSPFVVFPKLQDRLNSLKVDPEVKTAEGARVIDRLQATPVDVVRFANAHLGIGVGLYNYLALKNRVSISVDVGLFRARLDSASLNGRNDNATINVNLNPRDALFRYAEPKVSYYMVESRKFNLELSFGLMYLSSLNREIRLKKSWGTNFQANVNVHPNPDTREQSVFFRATLFHANGNFGFDPNNNLMLQIGYATPISKIFGS